MLKYERLLGAEKVVVTSGLQRILFIHPVFPEVRCGLGAGLKKIALT
jgi:hypothetical protein